MSNTEIDTVRVKMMMAFDLTGDQWKEIHKLVFDAATRTIYPNSIFTAQTLEEVYSKMNVGNSYENVLAWIKALA